MSGIWPIVVRSWWSNRNERAFLFCYPPEKCRLIYTINLIEGYHRQLRKLTKGKSMFPTDESLVKIISPLAKAVRK